MYPVRGLARTVNVDEIKKIVVATPRPGVPLHVGDVADVEIGHDIRLGGVTSQGQGEVVLGLGFMLMGENSHEVTDRLKNKLDDVKKTLPADVELTTAYDRTRLVDQVIHTVYKNLFEGGLLVVAVLFIFLGNLRAGLIVALAIPISMLFAFCGMLRFGIAGSLLSLGAIDFGLVVDSSVVMVENVVRHLAHDKNDNRSRLDIVRDAAIEVRDADHVRRTDYHDRLPADPDAGRRRGQAVSADGADGDLRPARLAGLVADAHAGAGQPVAAAAHRRERPLAGARRALALRSVAAPAPAAWPGRAHVWPWRYWLAAF